METLPPGEGWPLLQFVRDFVFIPAIAAVGWLWNEIRLVKRDNQEQLDRIETSVRELATVVAKHQLDDLTRFASKDDLGLVRIDVNALRQHIDDRFDRVGDLIVKTSGGR